MDDCTFDQTTVEWWGVNGFNLQGRRMQRYRAVIRLWDSQACLRYSVNSRRAVVIL